MCPCQSLRTEYVSDNIWDPIMFWWRPSCAASKNKEKKNVKSFIRVRMAPSPSVVSRAVWASFSVSCRDKLPQSGLRVQEVIQYARENRQVLSQNLKVGGWRWVSDRMREGVPKSGAGLWNARSPKLHLPILQQKKSHCQVELEEQFGTRPIITFGCDHNRLHDFHFFSTSCLP